MSLGTSAKTGFSVRDILDLPDSTGRCGSGTEETEEDENEEASAEVSGSENVPNLEFSGGGLCERAGQRLGRWSSPSGNLHFSRESIRLL